MYYTSHEIASVTRTLTMKSYNMAPLNNALGSKLQQEQSLEDCIFKAKVENNLGIMGTLKRIIG